MMMSTPSPSYGGPYSGSSAPTPEPIKLLVFKIMVGTAGLPHDEAMDALESVQAATRGREVPGYSMQYYVLPDPSSEKVDMILLYPPANTFVCEKELLDLLTSKGDVPKDILDKIKKEIEAQ